MLFLKMCEMAMCLFSKLYFKTHLFSEFLCLSQDSVANIRLKVVSLLPSSSPYWCCRQTRLTSST